MFHFYTPWKRQETFGFLKFSKYMKMEPLLKIDVNVLKIMWKYTPQIDDSTNCHHFSRDQIQLLSVFVSLELSRLTPALPKLFKIMPLYKTPQPYLGWVRQKATLPTNFALVASINVGISPQNFLTYSFNPFATLV